ncbi:MAG: hypothetical protein LBL41_03010 [Bifidobacteriaceae bacterium]|jgi:hypothetical protein|nr:hypothetical protein [Bifidobacteriaceae bacterium]
MINKDIETLIISTAEKMIDKSCGTKKIKLLTQKHGRKIHFVPKKYRVFGGLLQSMNIQFGNFIEILMTTLVGNEPRYTIVEHYSGKRSNKFTLSQENSRLIDNYITKCQTESDGYQNKHFNELLQKIQTNRAGMSDTFNHDIDLLFQDNATKQHYFLEIKYNDDHDTGKFVDINRKFIKTYAYLSNELQIAKYDDLVPILFFFNDKKMKGNIYVPEATNIMRGSTFFDEFLTKVDYSDLSGYMHTLSESKEVVKMFDDLYKKVMERE